MEGDLAAIVVRSGVRVAERVAVARSLLARLRGLLGHPSLAPGEGLLLAPCNSVHTVGMRYPIDVLFLDRSGRVARAVHTLTPGHIVPYVRGATQAIELPAGTLQATGVRAGDEVWLVSVAVLR
ncbi:MAG: DUF192 domain-containing protein [Dehalococcoidia bacterium]|nr:DUF192 domain-containing protein [Dehalococcoidia bacterium]